MESEQNKVLCSNCNKFVAEEKMMVHEAYCFRNFMKCLECGEMIDKQSKKDHEDEFHKMVNCKHCNNIFSVQEIKNHEIFCNEKPKLCIFCNLEIKFKEYSSHVYQCSTRTKTCEFCQKFIIMRDFEDHLSKCYRSTFLYNQEFPSINKEEGKNSLLDEEKKNEDSNLKKKIASPKISQNQSPLIKKKSSKTNCTSEFDDYWQQQDEIIKNENINQPSFTNQENNILLPNLPLINNMSIQSNEDPELQRILYESLASNKYK